MATKNLTLTAFAVEQQGDSSFCVFTMKGAAKLVPASIEHEEKKGSKGHRVARLADSQSVALLELGKVLVVNGASVDVSEDDSEYYDWFKVYFVPTSNGGGLEVSEEGAEAAPAEDPDAEVKHVLTLKVKEIKEQVLLMDDPAYLGRLQALEQEKGTKARKSVLKAITDRVEAIEAVGAFSAPKLPVEEPAAEETPAPEPKKAKAPKKAAAPKVKKATKKAKPVAKPKKAKPEPKDYDTAALEKALLDFANEHGVRVTKFISKRITQCLTEEKDGIVLGDKPPEIKTIGIVPGRTYTVERNHRHWGLCSYTVEIQADRTVKLVNFEGNDAKRGLKVGTVYAFSKDFMKQVLQKEDPHVSFYQFFKLSR